MILPIENCYISAILKIAECSKLSVWSFDDYAEEVKRPDSLGFVFLNNLDSNLPKTLGFIIARLIKFQHSNMDILTESEEFECEILNVAVHTKFRREGIGQILFDALVGECTRKNVKSIWLEVRKGNESAIRFYKKNGFDVVYTRKNYYQNPVEDAMVMKVDLR